MLYRVVSHYIISIVSCAQESFAVSVAAPSSSSSSSSSAAAASAGGGAGSSVGTSMGTVGGADSSLSFAQRTPEGLIYDDRYALMPTLC